VPGGRADPRRRHRFHNAAREPDSDYPRSRQPQHPRAGPGVRRAPHGRGGVFAGLLQRDRGPGRALRPRGKDEEAALASAEGRDRGHGGRLLRQKGFPVLCAPGAGLPHRRSQHERGRAPGVHRGTDRPA